MTTKTINEEILKPIAEKYNNDFIRITDFNSSMFISIQDGPIKEGKKNGAQIDILGQIWLEILRGFNKKFPCRENSITITKIEEALMWQEKRKTNRISRKVEGYSKA